jgi:hypothetical protein
MPITRRRHRLFASLFMLVFASGLRAAAQAQSAGALPAGPALTMDAAEKFLTDAGVQACEISEVDPFISRVNGAVRSLNIGVAKDCGDYDAADPTVVIIHKFADSRARDALVASFKDLRYRAIRAYSSVWVVDSFVVVLLGPQRAQIEELLKAEYRRRHPGLK